MKESTRHGRQVPGAAGQMRPHWARALCPPQGIRRREGQKPVRKQVYCSASSSAINGLRKSSYTIGPPIMRLLGNPNSNLVFFQKHNINIDIYTYIIIHSCEYMYTYLIPVSIFKRLDRFDLKIYEVGRLTVDRDVVSH
jgi:hypothetical protein